MRFQDLAASEDHSEGESLEHAKTGATVRPAISRARRESETKPPFSKVIIYCWLDGIDGIFANGVNWVRTH